MTLANLPSQKNRPLASRPPGQPFVNGTFANTKSDPSASSPRAPIQPQREPPLPTRHRGAQAVTSRLKPGQEPKLLDQVSNVLRTMGYSIKTEKAYNDWIYRFIIFYNKRHPREMGVAEIGQFLTHLAVEKHVAASTQNQALAAILFLYKHVLKIDFGRVDFTWAKRPEVLPVILSLEEVRKIIGHLAGTYALMAKLLYGCGLRISECAKLRVHPVR